MKLIQKLKSENQDFEFYPTTKEILKAVTDDLKKIKDCESRTINMEERRALYRGPIGQSNVLNTGLFSRRHDAAVLDIGAGKAPIFDALEEAGINVNCKMAIEESRLLADQLTQKNIEVIGRDFFETNLMTSDFSLIFCNPPYASFAAWIHKIMSEVNANIFYFVIPQRWQEDETLVAHIQQRGHYEILGDFDFLEGDRPARAKVNLVRVLKKGDVKNTFDLWIENNIGSFENKNEEEKELKEENRNNIRRIEKDGVKQIIADYQQEMNDLLHTFKSLSAVPMQLLQSLDINKEIIIAKIRNDIQNLKSKYWKKAFEMLNEITSRLNNDNRSRMLRKINWINKLDLNESNIRTVVIFVINNYQDFAENEILDMFDRLTNPKSVRAYKSNQRWSDWHFRYTKKDGDPGQPERYSLDYRTVVPHAMRSSYYSGRQANDFLEDLLSVAYKLGFISNSDVIDTNNIKYGCKYQLKSNQVKASNKVLFEVTPYKNCNIHVKMNKEFQLLFNVEVGKLRGWIKSPKDIQQEFDVTEAEAQKLLVSPTLANLTQNLAIAA